MSTKRVSTRSKVLFWLNAMLSAVGFGVVLAVVISLGEYYFAGWEDAPVPEMGSALVWWALVSILPMLALRMALRASLKKDASEFPR